MTVETRVEDAPSYPHGFVTGRYLTAVADGPDADRLMDFTPAKGRVVFTPERVIRRHEGPSPALVVQRPVECALDDQGYLTSPGGGRGVYLIAGIYAVRFEVQGATVPGPKRIEVKPEHTEDSPLDLVLAMPEVVPPGSVVVVDETTAQRAEAAAARAEAIVTDIESEVRAAVLASPELKGDQGERGDQGPQGEKGDRGEVGPAPEVSWSGDRLTVGGQTGPSLTGPKGDPGAPGVVSSASYYVLVGPGRPDTPATTGGVITGSEPVGTEYRSTDGAGVGAYVWIKRPGGKWAVTDGDTGWRGVPVTFQGGKAGTINMRRVGVVVYMVQGAPGAYRTWGGLAVATEGRLYERRLLDSGIPGFQPSERVQTIIWDVNTGAQVGLISVTYPGDGGYIAYQLNTAPPYAAFTLSATTLDPWPTTLPGTPT